MIRKIPPNLRRICCKENTLVQGVFIILYLYPRCSAILCHKFISGIFYMFSFLRICTTYFSFLLILRRKMIKHATWNNIKMFHNYYLIIHNCFICTIVKNQSAQNWCYMNSSGSWWTTTASINNSMT